MAYILKNLPQYEQANEQLSMLSKRWQKEIDAAQQDARVMATNYQTEQIFLSETMRTQREQEIVKKEQEVLELKRKYFGQEGNSTKSAKRSSNPSRMRYTPPSRTSPTRNGSTSSRTAPQTHP